MICPECKCRYREGFDTCADCHVPLVSSESEPDDEKSTVDSRSEVDDEDSTVVFTTNDSIQANMVHGFLIAQGVDAQIINDNGTGYGFKSGIVVVVPPDQRKEAEELIQKYSSENTEETLPSDNQGPPAPQSVSENKSPVPVVLKECPHCKARCESDSNFCDQCGKDFAQELDPLKEPKENVIPKVLAPKIAPQENRAPLEHVPAQMNFAKPAIILGMIGLVLIVISLRNVKNINNSFVVDIPIRGDLGDDLKGQIGNDVISQLKNNGIERELMVRFPNVDQEKWNGLSMSVQKDLKNNGSPADTVQLTVIIHYRGKLREQKALLSYCEKKIQTALELRINEEKTKNAVKIPSNSP